MINKNRKDVALPGDKGPMAGRHEPVFCRLPLLIFPGSRVKICITLLFVFAGLRSYCQNEFAAASFYDDFKKIYADAQAGFVSHKGERLRNSGDGAVIEYRVKIMLPLADSGKIVIPAVGDPYVRYYFEPKKRKTEIDQRATNLLQAVRTAFGKPLYVRTETSAIKDRFFSNSLYFTRPDETQPALAAFKSSIYFFNSKYYLSFEIRGKHAN